MVVASPTVEVVEEVDGAHEGPVAPRWESPPCTNPDACPHEEQRCRGHRYVDEAVHDDGPREWYQEVIHEYVDFVVGDT